MISLLFNLLCIGSIATFGVTCSLINKFCKDRCRTICPHMLYKTGLSYSSLDSASSGNANRKGKLSEMSSQVSHCKCQTKPACPILNCNSDILKNFSLESISMSSFNKQSSSKCSICDAPLNKTSKRTNTLKRQRLSNKSNTKQKKNSHKYSCCSSDTSSSKINVSIGIVEANNPQLFTPTDSLEDVSNISSSNSYSRYLRSNASSGVTKAIDQYLSAGKSESTILKKSMGKIYCTCNNEETPRQEECGAANQMKQRYSKSTCLKNKDAIGSKNICINSESDDNNDNISENIQICKFLKRSSNLDENDSHKINIDISGPFCCACLNNMNSIVSQEKIACISKSYNNGKGTCKSSHRVTINLSCPICSTCHREITDDVDAICNKTLKSNKCQMKELKQTKRNCGCQTDLKGSCTCCTCDQLNTPRIDNQSSLQCACNICAAATQISEHQFYAQNIASDVSGNEFPTPKISDVINEIIQKYNCNICNVNKKKFSSCPNLRKTENLKRTLNARPSMIIETQSICSGKFNNCAALCYDTLIIKGDLEITEIPKGTLKYVFETKECDGSCRIHELTLKFKPTKTDIDKYIPGKYLVKLKIKS